MAIRVIIVDDHSVVRQGLQNFLGLDPELQIVGTATNGREAVERTRELKPDVVLMDLFMPEMDGFEATKIISEEFPEIAVMVLTSSLDSETINKTIQVGASGFLLKNMEAEALCHSIKTASKQQITLSPQVAQILTHAVTAPEQDATPVITTQSTLAKRQEVNGMMAEKLTGREHEVLQMMAQGLTNKEIAYNLGLSEKTVKVHVSIILAKLGMQSRTQAALHAAKLGLISY